MGGVKPRSVALITGRGALVAALLAGSPTRALGQGLTVSPDFATWAATRPAQATYLDSVFRGYSTIKIRTAEDEFRVGRPRAFADGIRSRNSAWHWQGASLGPSRVAWSEVREIRVPTYRATWIGVGAALGFAAGFWHAARIHDSEPVEPGGTSLAEGWHELGREAGSVAAGTFIGLFAGLGAGALLPNWKTLPAPPAPAPPSLPDTSSR